MSKFKVGDTIRVSNSRGELPNGTWVVSSISNYPRACFGVERDPTPHPGDDNPYLVGYYDIEVIKTVSSNEKDFFRSNSVYLADNLYLLPNELIKQYNWDVQPKTTIMQKLTSTLKRILSASIQSQYKAGFRNGDLALTAEGRSELLEILAAKYEAELTARAEEVIAESKDQD